MRELCPAAHLRYISSSDNPADILTKDISADDLLTKDLWWNSPEWLVDKTKWTLEDPKYELHPTSSTTMQVAQIKIGRFW